MDLWPFDLVPASVGIIVVVVVVVVVAVAVVVVVAIVVVIGGEFDEGPSLFATFGWLDSVNVRLQHGISSFEASTTADIVNWVLPMNYKKSLYIYIWERKIIEMSSVIDRNQIDLHLYEIEITTKYKQDCS